VNLAAFQGYGGRLEVAKEDLKTHPDDQVSSESTAEPREVQLIYSVTVFSPREKELIYDEDGSTAAFNGTVREVSGDHKVVYRFVIPEDVPAADCTLWVGNQFAISLAADAGGKPGEFHEELNAITMLGRKVYDQENKYWYTVDLTPYLKDNPSRTVYLAVTDAEPRDGWGALISRLDVAVLDEAERARVKRIQTNLDRWVKEDRSRFPVSFAADGGPAEAKYLLDAGGSAIQGSWRQVTGNSSVLYRLPLGESAKGSRLDLYLWGDFLVRVAPAAGDQPGAFAIATRGRDPGTGQVTAGDFTIHVPVQITPEIIASGACYVRIENDTPDRGPGARVVQVSIRRP